MYRALIINATFGIIINLKLKVKGAGGNVIGTIKTDFGGHWTQDKQYLLFASTYPKFVEFPLFAFVFFAFFAFLFSFLSFSFSLSFPLYLYFVFLFFNKKCLEVHSIHNDKK